MNALLGAVAVVAGAAITGLVAWLIARRNTSGEINTTQAETLWEESRTMRTELRAQVEGLTAVVTRLRAESDARDAALERLRDDADECRAEIRRLRAELDAVKRGLS